MTLISWSFGENDPKLYGYITAQCISRAEIQKPKRTHITCMAITADNCYIGRPSSWSAEIDSLASGYFDNKKRLFIVSAGNVEGQMEWNNYPQSNITNTVHNPGQSWNALTVGAFTEKDLLINQALSGFEPVAPRGGLSPYSSTSSIWEVNKWPVKPDVVLEGGNVARDESGFCTSCDDLSLLSTSYKPTTNQFDTIWATSAATSKAAWMAAQIQVEYPKAWPETIRALIVHSAKWTDTMKCQFLKNESKTEYKGLLRICGYGVPDLESALMCARNSVNLIIEDELQPYEKRKSEYKTRDMHLHELPWPKEVLLNLGEIPLTMRITLSYFIEPGPGEIGWKDRYRYPSCVLRYDLNNSNENRAAFIKRINAAAEEDNDDTINSSGSSRWKIGTQGRDLGSIHSDIWEGTAAELATCNLIGIYPKIGWWRMRANLGRWNKKIRYALVVSIHTPDQSVDLYTPILNKIRVKVPIPINVK